MNESIKLANEGVQRNQEQPPNHLENSGLLVHSELTQSMIPNNSESDACELAKSNFSPNCWASTSLGNVAEYINGRAFKPTEWKEQGKPIIRIQNLNNKLAMFNYSSLEHEEKYLVRNGELLFAWSASLGVYIWQGEEAWLNQHIFKVLPYEHVDKKFLYHLLDEVTVKLYAKTHGSGMVHVTKGKFEATEIELPPLAEQQQIAAKLDELLAQVDNLKTRLDNIPKILKRFRQSVLAAAVSGKLTEEWRSSEDLIDWKQSLLGDLVNKPSYGTSSKSQEEGKIPVLRMGNLQDGKLNWSNLVYTSDEDEIRKYRLYSGDILFNRTNSPELVGKTSIYRGEREAIYAGYLIRVQCTNELNPEYLNILLNSTSARAYCRAVKSDGVSQSNINAQKLIAYPVNCPPIEEQTEIVTRVEQLFAYADQIEQRVKDAQSRVNHLTQAILAKAFRGELTADWRAQNPELISGENSAEALLARIKTEREQTQAVKKAKATPSN